MKLRCSALVLLVLAGTLVLSAQKAARRLQRAGEVFHEIMATPDHAVPRSLLKRAQCIAIIPGVKRVGLGFGGDFGRGLVTCRTRRSWSAPLFLTLGGGSFGLQMGAQQTDLVLLILNEEGENYLLKDKFQLGGDMAATAGPVGREADASTDVLLHAKMLAYSRRKGLCGITLKGGVIKQDDDSNHQYYGATSPSAILHGEAQTPAAAQTLLNEIYRAVGR